MDFVQGLEDVDCALISRNSLSAFSGKMLCAPTGIEVGDIDLSGHTVIYVQCEPKCFNRLYNSSSATVAGESNDADVNAQGLQAAASYQGACMYFASSKSVPSAPPSLLLTNRNLTVLSI